LKKEEIEKLQDWQNRWCFWQKYL